MSLDNHALNGLLNSVQQQIRGVQDIILSQNSTPLAPALSAVSQQAQNPVSPVAADLEKLIAKAVDEKLKTLQSQVPKTDIPTIDPPMALPAPVETKEASPVNALSLGFLLKVMGEALTTQQQEWVTANLTHLPNFLLSEEGKASFQYTVGNMQRFVTKTNP